MKSKKGVKQWALCSTADSALVNPSIACKFGHGKYISCKTYNLNVNGKAHD